MRRIVSHVGIGGVTALCVVALTAAHPRGQAAPAAKNIVVVEKPTYVNVPMEVTVNRPAADVWKRVGGYCDLAELLQMGIPCKIVSGKDGEVGAVRSLGNEIIVGQSQFSYTYTTAVRGDRPYDLYHGTLEVRPVTATTSKILYTLVYDNSMLADDAAREQDRARRVTIFTRAINNMKIVAEGGTLPPPPARGGAPAAQPTPGGRGNN